MNAEVEHIGKTLKEARVTKGLSQRALAKNSGIPQSHISKIECVGVDVTLGTLLALSRALDLEPVLVPRTLIPAVQSLIRSSTHGLDAVRPAYTLDEEDG